MGETNGTAPKDDAPCVDPCIGCRLYRFEGENDGMYHEKCGICSRFYRDEFESKLQGSGI